MVFLAKGAPSPKDKEFVWRKHSMVLEINLNSQSCPQREDVSGRRNTGPVLHIPEV